jgi:hypothetical protein
MKMESRTWKEHRGHTCEKRPCFFELLPDSFMRDLAVSTLNTFLSWLRIYLGEYSGSEFISQK